MSSPSKVGGSNGSVGIRDGTRVILREITANLQNSPPGTSPRRKTGNEASSSKIEHQQHDVKVRFIREFADATGTTVRDETAEHSSLSSASSFQSLASTLSSKCSSGICVDSSPNKNADTSYLTSDISGLDDLITACENINLDETNKEEPDELRADSEDNNPDETFKSATDQASLDRTRDNSPIVFPNEDNRHLDVTTNIERGLSPINCSDEADRNFNITTDIDAATSEFNDPNEPNFNLNVTAEIKRSNSPTNCHNREYFDPNITTEIRNENLKNTSHQDRLYSELNVTQDLTIEKSTTNLNAANVDLDATRAITEEYPTNRITLDLDDTREISRGLSSPSTQREKPRNFDGEGEISSASNNLESCFLDIAKESCVPPAIGESIETFVNCINDIGQVSVSDKSDTAFDKIDTDFKITKTDDSPIDSRFADNANDEGLKRYEAYPLELITPSISQFHENLCLGKIEEKINVSEASLVKVLSNLNAVESEVPQAYDKPDQVSKTLTNESGNDAPCPALPSLSSICSSSDRNEKINLSKIPNDGVDKSDIKLSEDLSGTNGNDNIQAETPSVAETITGVAGNDRRVDNSTSPLPESNFFTAQSFAEKSNQVHDVRIVGGLQVPSPSKEEKLEPDANYENLHIGAGQLNITRNVGGGLNNEQTELVNENNIEEKKGSIIEESAVTNAEIEKESFPEIGDKRDDSNENLNVTVIAENLSTEDIPAIPEPEHYSEFAPQRQSTTFDPRQEFQLKNLPPVRDAPDVQNIISRPAPPKDDYSAFIPQKQSTALDNFTSPLSSKFERQRTPTSTTSPSSENSSTNAEKSKARSNKKLGSFENHCNFAQLELAANSVANDIFNSSLELTEENEHFVSAESELFQDPTNFDFLLSKTPKKNTQRNLRELSLYVKFDPLLSNSSMLPQGNIQNASPPVNEARNGDNNTAIPNIGTPKLNPAIAAIDRLLFYSPMTANIAPTNVNTTVPRTNDVQEKLKPVEETNEDTINMAKELELVRTTVLQLEEQLEKMKIDHEEALEKQASYKEKINQLQAQLAQEIKHKNEITVVVDEYEISISRLVAERERDRKNLDLEKAKLQEELAAAKHHLDNTEAAFNDVHLKYERLKAVVATYKNNEAALKESLQENVEIIKSLENRYEQVKSHATARLEKANQDLEEIRKQNESETVRLQAMLRKAELKSNSLAELVEQKSKENKELTQILDEVIARVGRNKAQ